MLPVKKILILFLLLSGLLAAVLLALQRQDIRQRAFWYYRPTRPTRPTPVSSWLESYRVVETIPLVTDGARQEKPAIWGNHVVWQDWRVRNSTLFVYDLQQRSERRLGEMILTWDPDISESDVVYQDMRNFGPWAYNLANSLSLELDPLSSCKGRWPTAICFSAQIFGSKVIWTEVGLTTDGTVVKLYDLDTNQLRIIHTDKEEPYFTTINVVRIHGNKVVWERSGVRFGKLSVEYRDLETGAQQRIAGPDDFFHEQPDISEKFIVWQDTRLQRVASLNPTGWYYDLYGFDLKSGQEFVIASGNKDHLYPHTDDRLVVWQDNRAGNWDIYAYDLATCREFPVAVGSHDEVRPAVYGEWVVWEDFRNDYDHAQYNSDIYASRLSLPALNTTAALVSEPCPSRSAFVPLLPPTVTVVPTATVTPTPTVTPTITLIPTLRPTATLTPTISATPPIIGPSLQPTPITALSDLTVAIENLGIFDRVTRRVITPTPGRPIRIGDTVVFDVRGRETAGVRVTNSFITRVELYRGDQLLGSYENYSAGLYASSNFAFRVDWSKIPGLGSPTSGISPAGNYRLRVKIDSQSVLVERNEVNNEAEREFNVQ